MFIREPIEASEIHVAIPLTAAIGKARIKRRDMLNAHGLPVATCQTPLTQNCYVEWQMGYDVVTAETGKLELTTLKHLKFTGANGKEKALYELSEYAYYLAKWDFIQKSRLTNLQKSLAAVAPGCLFDAHPDLSIKRSHFIEKEINGISFLSTRVEYPLVVHKFGKYEIVAEIMTKEKQRAVGVQPMLYFCFPVAELKPQNNRPALIGRKAESKEFADFVINKSNAPVFLQLLRLFGMLSDNHRKDIISIINVILKF